MKQTVTIEEIKDGKMMAGCDKSLCEGCKASFFCTSKKSSFQVLNPEGIKLEEGDKAIIDMPPGKTLLTVFMSLGLPLLMFIPGYFIGSLISGNEGIKLLCSLLAVGLGFIIAAIFFHVKKEKYTPRIIDKEERTD